MKKIVSEDFDKTKKQQSSQVSESNETKKKSNAQKALAPLIIAVVSLVIILVCVLIAYYQIYTSGTQNAKILEGVYASSYYSMVDNVNNLSVDISKYSNLSTSEAKINTLEDMKTDCNYILAGLSILPINQENVVSATKFFNQVNGVCDAYSKKLARKENLSIEQELLLDEINLVLSQLKENFNTQNLGMYDTGFNFVDASVFDRTGMNELSSSMGDISSEEVVYPSMIFDGPFSSALETRVVKGLGNKECSKDEAKDYILNKIFSGRNVDILFLNETNGDIDSYNFEVTTDEKRFELQISKLGCLLITMNGYAESFDPIINENQAGEIAKNFANNIGFESMSVVWHETHENVTYINLAPMIEGVIYYPDLVKVKVDLTSQEIIGFEAVNYALNHVDRNPVFNLNDSECEGVLGFDYEIYEVNKTVIKLDNGQEISAYEFIIERIDGDYFYYINANNKEIAKVLKLVKIKDVEKLI